MAALIKAATQTKSSMKMEFLATKNIVLPGSRLDHLEKIVNTLSTTVNTLVQRIDGLFPQASNVPGSVSAATAASTMMVGNRTGGVALSSSSAPSPRSQGEKGYASEEDEEDDVGGAG
eukprot:gene5547-3958_t